MKLLILGAHSDIARATARAFAERGAHLVLALREPARIAQDAEDLRLRGAAGVDLVAFDVLEAPDLLLSALPDLPDVVLCAVGVLGDQAVAQSDPQAARAVMRANFEGPALVLGALAQAMETRGSGVIIGISSVAGERGRASNYVYGAAKAGFTAFLSGLRNRLAGRGLRVITVLPGFVATRMTEGLPLNPRLTAQPDEVARAIARALDKGADIVWVRPIWRVIMAVIRALPESVFKRTKL
jgi:decaprenylphospho-beta-D-erythro-pentofuranosid-2-ulose 2-reductase